MLLKSRPGIAVVVIPYFNILLYVYVSPIVEWKLKPIQFQFVLLLFVQG